LIELLWSLPIVTVAAIIASGRVGPVGSGLGGTICALAIGLTCAPLRLDFVGALLAAAKGIWLGSLVGAVILGGLFFRAIVSTGTVAPATTCAKRRRRQLFTACFLIGPFAESATGYGVGQVAIASMIRSTGAKAMHAMLLGLFSQTLVPWGAMAIGTTVGAELSGVPARTLGVHCAVLTAPLLFGWLIMYWRIATAAGTPGTITDLIGEFAWVVTIAALLVAANLLVGPEVAAMLALGPLIMLRLWNDEHADPRQWQPALRVGIPYAVLVVGLALTRSIPAIGNPLRDALSFQPFNDSPSFAPLIHPSCWLVVVAILSASVFGQVRDVGHAARQAWLVGRKSVMTIGLYLIMAQIMRGSGVASELAKGMRTLGPFAILTTPLLGATFGFLTGSANGSNGLLMVSQSALAMDNHFSVAWVAALQTTAAAALTMLSPVRLAMGCALAGSPGLERSAYARAWPLGAVAVAILSIVAAVLLFLS